MVFTSIFSYNKNTMFRSFHARLLRISAMLVLLVLPLAVSCRLGEENTSVLPDSGKAYVSIAGTGLDDGRTALPAVTESDVTSFTLSGKFSDSADAEKTLGTWTSSTAMKNASVPLNAGTWNFTLTAQINGATYRAVLTEKVIVENETTPLSFELVLSEIAPDGKGSVSITVAFPTKNVAKVSGALYAYDDTTYSTPISGSQKETESVSGGTYTYSLSEIGSGTYVAVFQLWGKDAKSGEWLKVGSPRREYCGIIDGKTSESTVTFTATDTVFSILYRLNGGTLSGNWRGSFTRREESDITLPAVTKEDQCLFKQDALFAGWYTTSDCSGSPVTTFTPSAQTTHLTLYAKWCPTVLYVTPGATATGENYWDGFTEASAFGTVGGAIAHINSLASNEGIASTHNWTLKLNATGNNSLQEAVSIGYVPAASLLIMGMNYDEVTPASKDTIWGGGVRTPVTISGTTPVTIRGIGISNVNESGGVASGLSGILINGTGKVTVEKSGLNGHTASGIRIEGNADVEFKDSWLGQNSAENGAGIYKAGSGTLSITNSTIENNTASASGGGVYVASGAVSLGKDVKIQSNTARNGGGVCNKGVFAMSDSAVVGEREKTAEATDASGAHSNYASEQGGGIYNDGGALYIGYTLDSSSQPVSDGTFTGGICYNYAAQNGGGVYTAGTGSVTMYAGLVEYNAALQGGGGVNVVQGSFTMTGGEIKSNSSKDGGGIYVTAGELKLESDAKVCKNTATNSGGGIYTNAKLTFANGTVSGNNATNNGGGVYSKGEFNFTGGMIGGDADGDGNTAAGNGGGIFNASTGILTMESGAVITGNSAPNGGGVLVFAQDTTHKFVMNGGEISNNKSTGTDAGGGAGVYTQGAFEMNGGIIGKTATRAGNASSVYGGGVFGSSTAKISMSGDASISGNTAKDGGGIALAKGGTLTMTNGTISENEVTSGSGAGGGVYCQGTFTMADGSISGNKAAYTSSHGGGVYLKPDASFAMSGGSISDNKSGLSGGGVYCAGTFSFTGGTISSNTVAYSTSGGAVYDLGTFVMGGSASIPAGSDGANDVLMDYMKAISLASPLTATTPVATITPGTYSNVAWKILSLADGSTTEISAEYDKFAVTPHGTEVWGIDSEGCLQKVLFNGITITVPTYTSDDLQLSVTQVLGNYVFTAKAGYASYMWAIDGNVTTTTTNTHKIVSSTLAAGSHTLLLIATDAQGKMHNATATITVE